MRLGQLIEGIARDGGDAGFAETRAAGARWTVWAGRAVRRVCLLARFEGMAVFAHGAANLADRRGGGLRPVSIRDAVFQNSSTLHDLFKCTVRQRG
jgi:hypothetical protein